MPRTLKSLPSRDGYRMPGEFEPHAGCWMLWPERPDNWRMGAKPAQAAFAAVATAISRSEPVTIGVSAGQFHHARSVLPPQVRVVELSSDDAWMRDVGPTFVVNGRGGVRGVDWMFNAWGGLEGGLYRAWNLDDVVAKKVLEIEGRDRYFAPFVLEGGAIHVDGQGTLITTEDCLLNPNRNPKLTRTDIERLLERYLGIELVIWLGRGVVDDETSGHVDNLCCFVRPGEVVLTWTEQPARPAVRSLARRVGATPRGTRCSRSSPSRPQARATGPAADDAAGSRGYRPERRVHHSFRRHAARRLVREFLHREPMRGRAAARRETRRCGTAEARRPCFRGER